MSVIEEVRLNYAIEGDVPIWVPTGSRIIALGLDAGVPVVTILYEENENNREQRTLHFLSARWMRSVYSLEALRFIGKLEMQKYVPDLYCFEVMPAPIP